MYSVPELLEFFLKEITSNKWLNEWMEEKCYRESGPCYKGERMGEKGGEEFLKACGWEKDHFQIFRG